MPEPASPDFDRAVTEATYVLGTVRSTHGERGPQDPKTVATDFVANVPFPNIPGYAVLELLGQGGMGVVFKARDIRLGRYVAIKMVASGPIVTESLRARFQAEARAVALLQHPCIAQVYLADTIENRPYFIMEYVEGGSLSRQIGGEPKSPREAAELVVKLAEAIDFSHSKGVIHRDLKPANVLLQVENRELRVEGEETKTHPSLNSQLSTLNPKIADFGLAKFLDSDSSSTKTGDILGTPSYMAPEQAGGVVKNVGPACDIYSLGAILYELLTGRPPFRTPDAMQTVLMVLSEEPVPPRKLQPTVPRDLETICLKCLEKQPAKRYATAGELAADLRRFLDDEPIQARPVGRWERGVKWAKRRPAWAALIAVCVLGLLGGVAAALWHNRQMQTEIENTAAERDKARKLFTIGHGLAKSLIQDHLWRLGRLSGSTPERERLANQLIAYLDGLSHYAEDDAGLLADIADAYEQVAAVQGNPYSQNLGKPDDSLRNYAKACEIWKRLAEQHPDDLTLRLRAIKCRGDLADIHFDQGRWDLAETEYRSVVERLTRLTESHADDDRIRAGRIEFLSRLGDVALSRGRLREAQSRFEESLKEYGRLRPDTPDKRNIQLRGRADLHAALADVFLKLHELPRAEVHAAAAMADVQPLLADNSGDARVRRILSQVLMRLGDLYSTKGQQAKARGYYVQALTHARALARSDPDNAKSQADLVRQLERMGTAYQADKSLKLEGPRQAAQHWHEALSVIEGLAARHPQNYDFIRTLGILQRKLPEALVRLKRFEEAEGLLHASFVSAAKLERIQKDSLDPPIARAESHFVLAQLAVARTRQDASLEELIAAYTQAVEDCRKSLKFWKQLAARQPLKPDQEKVRRGVAQVKGYLESSLQKLRATMKGKPT